MRSLVVATLVSQLSAGDVKKYVFASNDKEGLATSEGEGLPFSKTICVTESVLLPELLALKRQF